MSERRDDTLIYHVFADDGVESEALSAYGEVVRVGLNPQTNPYSDAIQADALSLPLEPIADLVVLHPDCYRWSHATRHVRDKPGFEYPDQIAAARRIGQEYGEHYIIENNPRAPLDDPIILNGRMFNIPLVMARAFECSFPVHQPEERPAHVHEADWWNHYARSYDYWRTVKGYNHRHRKDPFVKSGIPRPYVDYLIRYWLAERDGLDLDFRNDSELTDFGGPRHD